MPEGSALRAAHAQEGTVPQEFRGTFLRTTWRPPLTPQERRRLAQYETSEAVRDSTSSQRFSGVFGALQEVKRKELNVDPNMASEKSSVRREGVRATLLEVEQVSRRDQIVELS